MKSQVLLTVWYNISGEAAGEIWHWSLSGVKGLSHWVGVCHWHCEKLTLFLRVIVQHYDTLVKNNSCWFGTLLKAGPRILDPIQEMVYFSWKPTVRVMKVLVGQRSDFFMPTGTCNSTQEDSPYWPGNKMWEVARPCTGKVGELHPTPPPPPPTHTPINLIGRHLFMRFQNSNTIDKCHFYCPKFKDIQLSRKQTPSGIRRSVC